MKRIAKSLLEESVKKGMSCREGGEFALQRSN